RARDVVVDGHLVELPRKLELAARGVEALLDLPTALGRPLAQPALQLVERRRLHEDRNRARDALLDRQRALGLEVEHRHAPRRVDPLNLGPERAVPRAPRVPDVLDELSLAGEPRELVVGDEVVLAP